ncbi:hypothetical protein [Streptomyces decoyicus]|uniref:hypothetical protein n=1 Tax=Streptomyces decoyicus TaxID=249567 RepID=UPI003822BDE4
MRGVVGRYSVSAYAWVEHCWFEVVLLGRPGVGPHAGIMDAIRELLDGQKGYY